jgi:acyl-CoA thioesterase
MDLKRFLQTKGTSPFRELVGVTFTEAENGYSRCVLDVKEKLFTPGGFVHGGATFTMADSGMGVALWSTLEEGEMFLTIDSSIKYFKSVKSGTLVCESRVIHRSKNFAILESEITNDGHLIAKAMGTFSVSRGGKGVGSRQLQNEN